MAAIGAPGDRLASLAQLDFAKDTPYETHFTRTSVVPQTMVSPEILNVVRGLLRDVVQGGTAKRLAQGMTFPDGRVLDVYGKTSTGDQRFDVFAPGARLIELLKVNRTATFVFVIDDRFFGVLTAYVHEPYAAWYDFTSAMAVKLLRSLAPALQPLLNSNGRAAIIFPTANRH